MSVSSQQFRDLLSRFAAGVTLVTARRGDEIHGLTVSAFASVSADPPLVTVILDRGHNIHEFLRGDGASFAVNILADDQAELSDTFAFSPREERFSLGRWSSSSAGSPVLDDALAWLDCGVEAAHEAGSHVLYIGRVREGKIPRPEARPLVYWDREYRRVNALAGEPRDER